MPSRAGPAQPVCWHWPQLQPLRPCMPGSAWSGLLRLPARSRSPPPPPLAPEEAPALGAGAWLTLNCLWRVGVGVHSAPACCCAGHLHRAVRPACCSPHEDGWGRQWAECVGSRSARAGRGQSPACLRGSGCELHFPQWEQRSFSSAPYTAAAFWGASREQVLLGPPPFQQPELLPPHDSWPPVLLPRPHSQ